MFQEAGNSGTLKPWCRLPSISHERLIFPKPLERLVDRGYPAALGLSLREYTESLPLPPTIAQYDKSHLVLIDPRIHITSQLTMAGIIRPEHCSIQDLVPVPPHPYWILLSRPEGRRRVDDTGGRSLTVLEGVSMVVQGVAPTSSTLLLAASIIGGKYMCSFQRHPWDRAVDAWHLVGIRRTPSDNVRIRRP